MALARLTTEIIDAAIFGFQEQKKVLDIRIAELQAMRTGAKDASPEVAPPARRKMSAAGRKAIAAAQRKRWAETKSDSTAPVKPAKKARRRLSAQGKANIVAALKKRWAAKKAAAKQ